MVVNSTLFECMLALIHSHDGNLHYSGITLSMAKERRKFLLNDALNTFCLQLYVASDL